ncbi:MAG: AAA family ATPase, partial [Prevotellaceae bacterium]|nr:AAA family ATPase [Prevotellaceae bacterium]
METRQKKLPTGIQTFEKIREENRLYVDKTKYLVNLIDSDSIYFLARPRRFGKSLTISTLEAMFSGKKELFKGLYAEEFMNRADYYPSPVIRLDMSRVTTNEGIRTVADSVSR